MARAYCKLITEDYERRSESTRVELDAKVLKDMDRFELEYVAAAPTPEGEGEWVWEVAGRRIARTLKKPLLSPSATLIAKTYWNKLGAEELIAKLR
jgi:hypothetical protein